ncbi:cobalamin biosynthesis protein [Blastococcus xanthinilyticus]|uniref:ABC transporter ATP-binding protein n=1 Tax=Blastococcus xanthinilyticus TaxID=1564164 RepID=A0A5S5CJX5_9ACTN|nr:cobalamin biosynthesis protein [Blastococcus xanthinilyticus]TYP80595.1 cobalt transport protein ATP-binding subunit [Blastococcus xanthinilyticus]
MSHRALGAAGLVVGYDRGRPVLDGARLSVPPGRRLAVLGANGSGKTTLLRCLSGALRPAAGTVTVDGRPLEHSRAGLRAHRQVVQLVLQDPDDQLFSASVAQDVSFGPLNLGLDEAAVRERVAEALALLAVEHLAARPTHQLSYGERKRVAIAGAVAMRPCVLLLDEPTAGLDPSAVAGTLAALTRLQEHDSTVVMSTHDVDLALRWADSVAVVVDRAVVQGSPAVVLGDGALLARARLARPWALEVGARLRDLGLLPPGPLPRDAAGLLAALPDSGPTTVGIGLASGVSAAEVLAAVDAVLPDPAGPVRLATLDTRTGEPGLRDAAARRGWPVTGHPAEVLAGVPVPSPSAAVAARVGTPSVAEAAALLGGGELVAGKSAHGRVTVAVARGPAAGTAAPHPAPTTGEHP